MQRIIEPELLAELSPSDPLAIAAHADLRRVNFIMGHADIRWRTLRRHYPERSRRARPLRLIELGAGDGTLLLELARSWAACGGTAEVTLVDRQDFVSAATLQAFAPLTGSVTTVTQEVCAWLEQPGPPVDVIFANLFLHEFPAPSLRKLLGLAAARTDLFIACEPRRSPLALTAARLLGLVGCNRISRHDGVISARAGFASPELSILWPAAAHWELHERSVGWFSHGFVAQRKAAAA
jgi:hypothetical protein